MNLCIHQKILFARHLEQPVPLRRVQQQLQPPGQLQAAHAQARQGAAQQGGEAAGLKPSQLGPPVGFRSEDKYICVLTLCVLYVYYMCRTDY